MFLEKLKNKETTQYQLTRKFISIFLGLIVAVNLIYLLAASSFIYEFLENKATGVFETIKNQEENQIDWQTEIDTFVSKKDDDGLLVTTTNKQHFFSEEASDIFNDLYVGKSLPFVPKIIFSDEGIYYVDEKKYGSFTAQVAINSETAMELISGMLMISLVLNLLAVILGSALIYRSVKSWSEELNQMAQEINGLNESNSLSIKVPEQPVEMKEVATAFNELLKNKEASMERERQFITDASHDLKTPIAAIRGHVQLIQRRGETHPEVVPKSMAFIDKESKRLEKLSRQLLELNRENHSLIKETVLLSALVLEEVEKNSLLHSRHFELEIENHVELMGIRSELQQVIQNVIENAIKYSPEETTISIRLKKSKEQICFEVMDEGIGIKEEEKEVVFERFYRADASRTSKIEGAGIGLSIVKKIVNSYQGTIQLKNNDPKGTRVIILLPR